MWIIKRPVMDKILGVFSGDITDHLSNSKQPVGFYNVTMFLNNS